MTPLQELLVDAVRAGLAECGQPQRWLAERTGMSQKHLSALLVGNNMGTLGAWDALLRESGGYEWVAVFKPHSLT